MRSRGRFGGVAAALGVAATASVIAGCSLLISLSGYSNPPDALDGDVRPDATQDAAQDADSGLDAADAGEAGPFCASADAGFCEDFDDAPALSRWVLSSDERAAHGVNADAFTSMPASLWAKSEPIADTKTAHSYRTARLPARALEVAYAFDLRIDQRGKEVLVVAGAGLDDLPDSLIRSGQLALGETGDFFEEAREGGATNSYKDHPLATAIPLGVWTRVSVSLSRQTDGSYRVNASLAGVPVLNVTSTLWTITASGRPYFNVGVYFTRGISPGWSVRVDNITFDAK